MVPSDKDLEQFVCGCCNRQRPGQSLADLHLETKAGDVEPLCRQCEDFIAQGLGAITERISSTGKRLAAGAALASGAVRAGVMRPPASRSIPPAPLPPSRRAASSTETEVLILKYLALERYIEGFVCGLEAAGLDRTRLSRDTTNALNSLLNLKQKFSVERLQVSLDASRPTRSEVRRLLRHMDESALTVDEYVRFVSEELSAAKPVRELSRPCRPPP